MGTHAEFYAIGKTQDLGVINSYSRSRVSNDNPYSEYLFRTIKYHPAGPLMGSGHRAWVAEFTHWYNEEHKNSGIKYVTPQQRHNGENVDIPLKRKHIYRQAQLVNLRSD
ncbi:hypothetical protein J4H73_05860 [Vibrio alginolyticus]|uniref:hypothetical protein n=1 Tax=Vibrio alginolyticus TaxID=663 RepID=UPI001BD328B9|nr:hypothetical protein [Vibrio alginolyticus]ELA9243551.1 hypothetical protein [Vibrio alginolyticus]ELA9245724.1 hypothetical protein [Vibrio alginolyticus]MBT0083965.1 hypothetical protein [Vibrio alginolyticus]